jgi:hypothetical protein
MTLLPQREFDGDFHEHVDRKTATARRVKSPLTYCGHGALIEAGAETVKHPDIADRPVAAHHDFEQDIARQTPLARFLGVLSLHLAQKPWRLDTAAGPIRPAAGPAAGTVADAGPESLSASTTLARSRSSRSARPLTRDVRATLPDNSPVVSGVCLSRHDRRSDLGCRRRLRRTLDWLRLNGWNDRRLVVRHIAPRHQHWFRRDGGDGSPALGAAAFNAPCGQRISQPTSPSAPARPRRHQKDEACSFRRRLDAGRFSRAACEPHDDQEQHGMKAGRNQRRKRALSFRARRSIRQRQQFRGRESDLRRRCPEPAADPDCLSGSNERRSRNQMQLAGSDQRTDRVTGNTSRTRELVRREDFEGSLGHECL